MSAMSLLNTTAGTSSSKLPLSIGTSVTVILTFSLMSFFSRTPLTGKPNGRFTSPRTRTFIFLLVTATALGFIMVTNKELRTISLTTIATLHVHVITRTFITTPTTVPSKSTVMWQKIRSPTIVEIPDGELTFLSKSQKSKSLWSTRTSLSPTSCSRRFTVITDVCSLLATSLDGTISFTRITKAFARWSPTIVTIPSKPTNVPSELFSSLKNIAS